MVIRRIPSRRERRDRISRRRLLGVELLDPSVGDVVFRRLPLENPGNAIFLAQNIYGPFCRSILANPRFQGLGNIRRLGAGRERRSILPGENRRKAQQKYSKKQARSESRESSDGLR